MKIIAVQIKCHCEAERSEAEAISDNKRDCFVGLRPPRNDKVKSYLKTRLSPRAVLTIWTRVNENNY